MFHRLRGDRLAVNFKDAGATAADTARAAEREGFHAESFILEIELKRMYPEREHIWDFPIGCA